jgi:hypothetical protein
MFRPTHLQFSDVSHGVYVCLLVAWDIQQHFINSADLDHSDRRVGERESAVRKSGVITGHFRCKNRAQAIHNMKMWQ